MPKIKRRRVVVITGASAGVGRATARAFAKEGACLGLIARGQDGLEACQREVEKLGGKALVLICDVADAKRVETCAQEVERHFGPIDVWVNNAMVSVFSPVKEMLPEEFKRVTEVTYLGYVYGTLAALKTMLPRNHGRIIQVGSALAYRSIPLQSAYCAAKHAVLGFTESLRTELLHDKSAVTVSVVEMPALNTPQFDWTKSRMPHQPQPVPPIFQPEVAADAILYLSHHPRKEMYVGYPTLKAITAEKIAPQIADWYLAKYGYNSQQTSEPAEVNRPNNLWHPVAGEFAAHGRFDARAMNSSLQLQLNKNRGLLLSVFGSLFAVFAISTWLATRRGSTEMWRPAPRPRRPTFDLRKGSELVRPK